MCNLYVVPPSTADLAIHFSVPNPAQLDIPTETKRGKRGIIVRGASGQRIMLEAKWGFPRPQKDRGGELLHHEPVNLIADLTNPMWSSMVPTRFANARKTGQIESRAVPSDRIPL